MCKINEILAKGTTFNKLMTFNVKPKHRKYILNYWRLCNGKSTT